MKVPHIFLILILTFLTVPALYPMETGSSLLEKDPQGEHDIVDFSETAHASESSTSISQGELEESKSLRESDDGKRIKPSSGWTLQDLPPEILNHIASFVKFHNVENLLLQDYKTGRTHTAQVVDGCTIVLKKENIFCFKFPKQDHAIHACIALVPSIHGHMISARFLPLTSSGKSFTVCTQNSYHYALRPDPSLLAIDPAFKYTIYATKFEVYLKPSVKGYKRWIENNHYTNVPAGEDREDANQAEKIYVSKEPITALAINDAGTRLAVGTEKGRILRLTLPKGECKDINMFNLSAPITKLIFMRNQDDRILAYTPETFNLLNYSNGSKREGKKLPGYKMFHNKDSLVTVERDKPYNRISISKDECTKTHIVAQPVTRYPLSSVSISPDKTKVAYATAAGVQLYNADYPNCIPRINFDPFYTTLKMYYETKPYVLAFSADSKSLYFVDRDSNIKVHEIDPENYDVRKQLNGNFQDSRRVNSIYVAALLYNMNKILQQNEKIILASEMSKMIYKRLPNFAKEKLMTYIINAKPKSIL